MLAAHQFSPSPVVQFDPVRENLLLLDLTLTNPALQPEVFTDTSTFSVFVDSARAGAGAKFAIGGYAEYRDVYSRSAVFGEGGDEEPRRLHLGIDIWGEAGEKVFAPLDGRVHSFAFNDRFGDYGATIIIEHTTRDKRFFSLYGHLSFADLSPLREGTPIHAGECIAHFGKPAENGHWPPHLHFQLILDMEGNSGDYPGVCRLSEREKYLQNCPDPDVLLGMMQYARKPL